MRGSRQFCNHFRSMSEHKECAAGVAYESLRGIPFDKRPCFCTNGKPHGGGCDKAEYPTPEEIAARDAEIQRHFQDMALVRTAIVAHLGGHWKKGMEGGGGSIPCPVCEKGSVRFSRSGYNGHIHARCSTPDCVAWME